MVLAVHTRSSHRPKSSKNERPIVRPDCSNYPKGIEDSLNGIAWSGRLADRECPH